jgi:hypothetical protein
LLFVNKRVYFAAVTLRTTNTNETKLAQTASLWNKTLDVVLQRGFYGTAAIEISVQDGTIQYVRRRLEQIEK